MTAASSHQGTATMLRFAAAAALLATSLSTAHAQAYPSKPIRLMIGYTAGGSAEAGARPLARALEPLLGQPLVFEYRPGNAGGVAMEAIARAPNDGYSLYYFDSGPLTVAPHLGKVGYDNIKIVHPARPRLRERKHAGGASVDAVLERRRCDC